MEEGLVVIVDTEGFSELRVLPTGSSGLITTVKLFNWPRVLIKRIALGEYVRQRNKGSKNHYWRA